MDETLNHKVDHEDICQDPDMYINIPSENSSQIFKVKFTQVDRN